MAKKRVFGTKEWASYNFNIARGCSHYCAYCYARYNDVKKFNRCTAEEWKTPVVDILAVHKQWTKKNGTIMFPTQHDILPEILDECIAALENMLFAGNNVLIVTKPHFECIKKICDTFGKYKDQILFRFTIGALDNDILAYWEPGAPNREERMEALEYAFMAGYKTSISMEPVLDWKNVLWCFDAFCPFVTDSIWIGVMNFIDQRVEIKTDEDRKMVEELKKWHTPETFKSVYEALKDHPKVKWKESMKSALGLELAKKIGEDK
jgi:DNA repair photolyase